MATVSVELTEPQAVVSPDGGSWGFVEAVTSGIRGAAQVLTVTLTVLIASSPLWLAALILFFPVRALIRRRRAAAAAPTAPTAVAPAASSTTGTAGDDSTPPSAG